MLKSVKTPDDEGQADIETLKAMDWTEKDIFEAAHHGADMIRHGTLFKTFKMATLYKLPALNSYDKCMASSR